MNLRLEVSDQFDSFDGMEGTYRDEGLSVGYDHMRIGGYEVAMEVNYSDLRMGRRIGSGACSAVNLATHIHTGEKYAVKMFNVYDKSQAGQLYKEIITLTSSQDCEALISFKGAFHNEGSIGMIIEFMDRGSLEFMLAEDIVLDEEVLAATIYQILWGLGYLHFESKLHRDVKPANVLINSSGQVKVSDFGISKELGSSTAMSNTAVGTFKYMSPERLLGQSYDKFGDIWSVGIMLIELWTKRYPFEDCASTPIDLLAELETFQPEDYVQGGYFPPLMADVIVAMLANDPGDRQDSSSLMSFEWFTQFGLDNLAVAQGTLANWLDTPEGGSPGKKGPSRGGFAKGGGHKQEEEDIQYGDFDDQGFDSGRGRVRSYGQDFPSSDGGQYYEDDFESDYKHNGGDSKSWSKHERGRGFK